LGYEVPKKPLLGKRIKQQSINPRVHFSSRRGGGGAKGNQDKLNEKNTTVGINEFEKSGR